jgi:hypothetical protein
MRQGAQALLDHVSFKPTSLTWERFGRLRITDPWTWIRKLDLDDTRNGRYSGTRDDQPKPVSPPAYLPVQGGNSGCPTSTSSPNNGERSGCSCCREGATEISEAQRPATENSYCGDGGRLRSWSQ